MDHAKIIRSPDGLHSILRQDPDMMMVGEFRDLETAEASIQRCAYRSLGGLNDSYQ